MPPAALFLDRDRGSTVCGAVVLKPGAERSCLSVCVCLRRRRAFVYRNPLPPPHSCALSLCLTTLQYPSSNEAGNGG